MVEAVWHGVLLVLGWSVNGGCCTPRQCPLISCNPVEYSLIFLLSLNQAAIQSPPKMSAPKGYSHFFFFFFFGICSQRPKKDAGSV